LRIYKGWNGNEKNQRKKNDAERFQ
jgi:hypothetical protein